MSSTLMALRAVHVVVFAALGVGAHGRIGRGVPRRATHEERSAEAMALEVPAAEPHPSAPEVMLMEPAPRATGLRVLLVDDVALNLDIASSFLALAGHHATCVDSGRAALEIAAASDLDVILMDVRMPGMDGLETARRIRALPPPRNRVRIVAMAAQVFADLIGECQDAGMDDYLEKPLERQSLLAAVTKAAALTRDAAGVASAGMPAASESDLNDSTYRQMLERVKPEDVDRHLRKLTDMAEQLVEQLLAHPGEPVDDELLHDTHRLGGCAALFGFDRLLDAARQFERAVENGMPDVAGRTQELLAATQSALERMRQLAGERLAVA